ncbi:undecaprenyldiphospho-muramoylpentapeptide beta-N-acetylglucosaminyltransferase [Algihabitans albus]|uniref:undecaprenyldiphospho-muramoylpentapeptide beta-N-acetylglucosaminyltransferase n=1 Tax=Algihabitans albus TaxID=2164067 RepID=UPI000E5D169D|nr:undecaprenyldiphospho-muramoylpentapeptide beta-N-acetylglucosaminyltransferase [Algihabitans albus]
MTGATDSKRRFTAVLAAGGTGGHMFPAQALARVLLERGAKVVLITDKRGAGFGPDLPQIETWRVSAGGVAGGDLLSRASGALRLGWGILQARSLLKRIGPDSVVGFGGYASVPTVFAAGRLGLRVILHEQNAVAGRANRLLAPKAETICTSFATVSGLRDSEQEKVTITGNPVRSAIAQLGRQPYGVPGPNDEFRLLVIGGSQGARVFNDVLPHALCRLPDAIKARLKVAQQVRGTDTGSVSEVYDTCGVTAELRPFFEDMSERLRAAHLLICRAGASTVAELAAAGRPAILVPYPFAADDHQTGNAQALAEAGGGWLLPQSNLTPHSLAERLVRLIEEPGALVQAAGCARAFAEENAAERLADVVLNHTRSNGGAKREEAAA